MGNSNEITIANAGTTLTLTGEISDEPCIGSDGNLVKSGPGTLVLRGDNSYQGNTDLVDGTLIVGHDHALGTGSDAEVRVGVEGTAYDANLKLLLENGVTVDHYVHVYNGNYSSYLEDHRRRKGRDADQPHRIKYRKLAR